MARILGLGAGANMLCPSTSPFDPRFMFVACAMSGLYRTFNNGHNRQMIESEAMLASTRCPLTFDATDRNTVYAPDPYRYFVVRTSTDKGHTWQTLVTPAE